MANRLNIQSKICPICGVEYTPARETTLACSRVCSDKVRYENYKQEFVCDYCGDKYIANKHNVARYNKHYCSNECHRKAYWEKNRNSHKIINSQVCKLCSTCKEWIPLELFRDDKSKWDNLSNNCVDCYRNYCKEVWSKTEKGILSRKQSKANRRAREKQAGKLTTETIKEVYDENINRFGELTCVYCLENCEQDWHLEHKTPLCRKGTNKKENLTISCPTCNLKKARKTEEEFSNPVTDATYTTSNYIVADLDSGDRLANLKITNGVKL
jgi:hypothetical protein